MTTLSRVQKRQRGIAICVQMFSSSHPSPGGGVRVDDSESLSPGFAIADWKLKRVDIGEPSA